MWRVDALLPTLRRVTKNPIIKHPGKTGKNTKKGPRETHGESHAETFHRKKGNPVEKCVVSALPRVWFKPRKRDPPDLRRESHRNPTWNRGTNFT